MLKTIHSVLNSQCFLERHWESQADIARFALQSYVAARIKDHAPMYRAYPEGNLATDYQLDMVLNRLLGHLDDTCQEAMTTVQRIADSIQQRVILPPGADIHRVRTQGRSGYALNIHRVNRGQLSTAWKRTHREHLPDATGVVTIVLCTDYTVNATSEGAMHTIAGTLALAQAIEQTGRRVAIWASILTHNAHNMRYRIVDGHPSQFHELDHVVVKQPEQSMSAPGLAALCSLSYLRNLFFHIWTMHTPTIGPMKDYGSATNKKQVYAALVPYLLREHIAPESVIMGADEHEHIHTLPAAVSWCQKALDTLAAQH